MRRNSLVFLLSFAMACTDRDKVSGDETDITGDTEDTNDTNDTDVLDTDVEAPTAITGWVSQASSGLPVVGATVKIGVHETTTDDYGRFFLDGLTAGDDQILDVTPAEPGLVRQSRPVDIVAEDAIPVAVQLAPMTSTTFQATDGVEFQPYAGFASAKITIAPNSLVDGNGDPAIGEVTIYAVPYDISTAESIGGSIGWDALPGDMTGIDADGDPVKLVSYGMVSVELYDSEGEKLQIAEGEEATVAIHLVGGGEPPSTIPLWYFDESTAKWMEEGEASLADGWYTGPVSHFTTWNVDSSTSVTTITGEIKWLDGSPLNTGLIFAGLFNAGYYDYGPVHNGAFSIQAYPTFSNDIGILAYWNGVALLHYLPAEVAGELLIGGTTVDIGAITLPWYAPPATFPNCFDLSDLPDGQEYDSANVIGLNLMFGGEYEQFSSSYYDYSDVVVKHVNGTWRMYGPSSTREGNPAITEFGIAVSDTPYENLTSLTPGDYEWLSEYNGLVDLTDTDLVMYTREGFSWKGQFTTDENSTELCYTWVPTDG